MVTGRKGRGSHPSTVRTQHSLPETSISSTFFDEELLNWRVREMYVENREKRGSEREKVEYHVSGMSCWFHWQGNQWTRNERMNHSLTTQFVDCKSLHHHHHQ